MSHAPEKPVRGMPKVPERREVPVLAAPQPSPFCFVALDFETANNAPDSACSVALVRVEGMKIVERAYHLIRPPSRQFLFTHIHGLTWADVAGAQPWGSLWPALAPLLNGASFIAAHNASFDQSVMRACCQTARVAAPTPDVCRHLRLKLDHHNALSDAEAYAQIVIRAVKDGAEMP